MSKPNLSPLAADILAMLPPDRIDRTSGVVERDYDGWTYTYNPIGQDRLEYAYISVASGTPDVIVHHNAGYSEPITESTKWVDEDGVPL